MARSLKSETLFLDDEDRTFFLKLLANCLSLAEYHCYAWVLMTNHYHLVVRTSSQELWQLMKPLNTRYAAYHKNKHGRSGPLFLDRYKSIVTQDQNYIQELVRYVHLNPIRAGICKNLDALSAYPWSGHSVLMGSFHYPFQDTKTVLQRFDGPIKKAQILYRSFLEEGLGIDQSNDVLLQLVRNSNSGVEAGHSAGCWIIGDPSFIKKAMSESEAQRLRISRFERDGGNIDAIAQRVAAQMGVAKERLQGRCRGGKESDARKIFVFVTIKRYNAPSKTVAQFCGVGQAAISAIAKAGRDAIVKQGVDITLF